MRLGVVEQRYQAGLEVLGGASVTEVARRNGVAPVALRATDATTGMSVSRLADVNGNVCFAGATYRTGRAWARQVIDVAGSLQLSRKGKVFRVHPIHHDRTRELGAFANAKGRPRRRATA